MSQILFPTPKALFQTAFGAPVTTFSQALAVAAGGSATVVSYSVPVGKIFKLDLGEFSGFNIAKFTLKIDGTVEAFKPTYFSGPLFGEFFFNGFEVTTGKIVLIEVENFRGSIADFSARITGRLVDA